jgi:hypothetical protein
MRTEDMGLEEAILDLEKGEAKDPHHAR